MNPSRQYVAELTLEEKLRFEQPAILCMTACFLIPVTINYFSSLAVIFYGNLHLKSHLSSPLSNTPGINKNAGVTQLLYRLN